MYVVRAFVATRIRLSNKDLARQLKALEQRIEKKLGSHDQGDRRHHRYAASVNVACQSQAAHRFVIDDDK